MPSTRYEGVYHAASGCQAASLSLTAARLRGLKWTYRVESQKTAGFFARLEMKQPDQYLLGRCACMLPLCGLKGDRLIAAVMDPHGKDDPDPHIGQCSHGDRMTFAFGALALVILSGPGFTLRGLPGKVVQRIAQRLDAAQATMRLGVHAALKQHGRGASQSLQTAGILGAAAIITDFRQQSWSQSLACTWQALKELMVLMGQKKGGNLLIILSDLLDQWQQLTYQHQHQACFAARGHGISLQMGLMQLLENLSGDGGRVGMLGSSEHLLELVDRSSHRRLRRGIGLQEQQRAPLLQFGKQVQGDWVIGYASGRELIGQTRLHADQAILIAREQFELSDLLAVWGKAMQIGQVAPSAFSQQVGINGIGLGPRGGSTPIDGARIDRIDGPACLQHVSNQQSMGRLDDAGHLLFGLRANDLLQEGVQFAQALRAMINTKRTDLMAFFINDHGVMMLAGPINPGIPHQKLSSLQECFLSGRALLLWRSKRDSLMIGSAQEQGQGSASFLNRSSRVEEVDFPWHVQQLSRTSVSLFQPCVERACS